MTEVPEALPAYRDLPVVDGGIRSGWGLFGEEDSVGLMNLITPEVSLSASKLVRTGQVFPLDIPLGFVDPPPFQRGRARHTVLERIPGGGLDDVIDNYHPQGGSQWDSLGHVPYLRNTFYNAATSKQVTGGERNTIEHWAERGIVTRGIVLDVAEAVAAKGGPGEPTPVTVDDLERARLAAGVEFRAGDILLMRTGFLGWYAEQKPAVRDAMGLRVGITSCGLGASEDMVEYLWDTHVSGIGSDTAGLEVFPQGPDPMFGSLHRLLIGQFGMALGELWNLDPLAAACHSDGVYEVMFTSAPLNVPGGIGSPANALAIR